MQDVKVSVWDGKTWNTVKKATKEHTSAENPNAVLPHVLPSPSYPIYVQRARGTNMIHWNCQLLPGFWAKPAVAVACIQPASLALTVSVSMATPLPESCLFESGSEFNLENRNMQV